MTDAALIPTLCIVAVCLSALVSYSIFVIDKKFTPPDKTDTDKLAAAEANINVAYRKFCLCIARKKWRKALTRFFPLIACIYRWKSVMTVGRMDLRIQRVVLAVVAIILSITIWDVLQLLIKTLAEN